MADVTNSMASSTTPTLLYGVQRHASKGRRVGYKAEARLGPAAVKVDDRKKTLEALRLRTQAGIPTPIVNNTGMATTGLALAAIASGGKGPKIEPALLAALQGGKPGKGKPGTLKRAVSSSTGFADLLGNLSALGWRVGETGVPGYGGVTPGAHAAGGSHYTTPFKVADINYGPGGSNAAETRKLAKLYKLLVRFGIPVNQYFYPGNDPAEHGDHGHLSVTRRRW